MLIYKRQPGIAVLVRFAFDECPTVGTVRICGPDGDVMDYAYRSLPGVVQPPANERNNVMSFTAEYLWNLLQGRQRAWQQAHPHAEMTFA